MVHRPPQPCRQQGRHAGNGGRADHRDRGFNAGQKWWLETPELEALATIEQALRLEHALKLAPQDRTHAAKIRVANIVTNLGFTKHRARKGRDRENRYWREK